MRIKIFFIIAFVSIYSYSQQRDFFLSSNISFESNSLNGLIFKDLSTGFIDDNQKNTILNQKNKHLINFELTNSFAFKEKIKNNLYYKFSFNDVTHINAKFDNDLLKVILKGNYEFQDETLEFNNTRFRGNRYQQFKLFFENKAENYDFGIGLSYVHGNHNFTFISNNASLYTAPFGTYLNLDYDINAYLTDTTDFSLFETNGNGIAFDFSGSLTILKHKINLYLLDLGYIIWNNNSNNIFVDSSYVFNGVNIDNVFDFNDSILEVSNVINDYDNINEDRSNFKSYLCSNIGMKVSKKIRSDKFGFITYGVNTRWQPYEDNKKLSFRKIRQGFKESDYKPFYYVETEFFINQLSILPKIGYGGYTNNFNVDLALLLKKNISFALGTQHLEYLLNKESSYGIGFYFKIYKSL